MEIDLLQVKAVVNRLLDHIIEARGVKVVEIKNSNYWNIPSDAIYDSEKPTDLDVGSFVDDWEFLSNLLDGNNQPIAYQLTELAPLIRYIGETIGKDLAKYGG
jgi:hypothetical protein